MLELTTEQFYLLWERFSTSELMDELPDDLEEFCRENGITFSYFLEEWL
jgi:hypothetical protein